MQTHPVATWWKLSNVSAGKNAVEKVPQWSRRLVRASVRAESGLRIADEPTQCETAVMISIEMSCTKRINKFVRYGYPQSSEFIYSKLIPKNWPLLGWTHIRKPLGKTSVYISEDGRNLRSNGTTFAKCVHMLATLVQASVRHDN